MKQPIIIPKKLKPFFWDVKLKDIHMQQHKNFVIERLLEEGNTQALQWLLQQVSSNDIERVVCSSRRITKKTAQFWKILLNITQPIVCIQQSSQNKHNPLWIR